MPQHQTDIQAKLAAFIAKGHHMHPGPRRAGRLRTLNELNRAFSRLADAPMAPGAAAKALRMVSQELHAEMRGLAPHGNLLKEDRA